ncbi:MAG: hypothetical protein ACREPE_01700 [Lysobacter sp.]
MKPVSLGSWIAVCLLTATALFSSGSAVGGNGCEAERNQWESAESTADFYCSLPSGDTTDELCNSALESAVFYGQKYLECREARDVEGAN